MTRLKQAGDVLCADRPDLAPDVADTVAAIIAGLTNVPSATTHGDLKPDHVLIDGDDVFLIDFDFLHVSDPMLDVACMARHLDRVPETVVTTRDTPKPVSQVFIDEYFAHAPGESRDRLPLYQAMASILDAARAQRSQRPAGQEQIDDVVRQAHRLVVRKEPGQA